MVVDMGTHMLRMVPGIHRITQLLVPGLEERARALPPLNSTYATPGKPCVISRGIISGRPPRRLPTGASSLPAGWHCPHTAGASCLSAGTAWHGALLTVVWLACRVL